MPMYTPFSLHPEIYTQMDHVTLFVPLSNDLFIAHNGVSHFILSFIAIKFNSRQLDGMSNI